MEVIKIDENTMFIAGKVKAIETESNICKGCCFLRADASGCYFSDKIENKPIACSNVFRGSEKGVIWVME